MNSNQIKFHDETNLLTFITEKIAADQSKRNLVIFDFRNLEKPELNMADKEFHFERLFELNKAL